MGEECGVCEVMEIAIGFVIIIIIGLALSLDIVWDAMAILMGVCAMVLASWFFGTLAVATWQEFVK
jgi:hypothetical protein